MTTEPRGSRLRLLPLLRRRWWLLVLTTAAVTVAAYAVSSMREESHTAQSLTVVPAGSTKDKAPGSANDAEQLAATYAAFIPDDGRVLRAISRAVRLPVDEVEDRFTVVNTSDTALLALRFRDRDARRAVDGARAAAEAVSDGTSPNVPARTMAIVKVATEPIDDTGGGGRTGLLAGLLVGLFLGAVAMVFLERADARGDDDRDFEDALGVPASTLGRRSVGPQVPLVDRWEQIAGRDPARVAFVPATRAGERLAREAAEALAEAACERGRYVAVESALGVREPALVVPTHAGGAVEPAHEAMVLAPAAGPGRDPSGESVGLSSDVVVLVVRRGDSIASAAARLSSLRGLGIDVERVLVAPRRMRVRSREERRG